MLEVSKNAKVAGRIVACRGSAYVRPKPGGWRKGRQRREGFPEVRLAKVVAPVTRIHRIGARRFVTSLLTGSPSGDQALWLCDKDETVGKEKTAQ